MKKLQTLADLKQVKQQIVLQAKERAAMEAARLEAIKKAQAQKEVFARSVGRVKPLHAPKKAQLVIEMPAPIPVQRQRDEQAVLREALSDEWDTTSLLDTDEALSFRRPGVGVDVVRKLRKGEWTVQAQLDLHNQRTEEAREMLGQFIR
ncbi:MAG: Smr/MutS family protein, partial [Brachymonas sp.]